jgi:hypothetical protein
MAWVWAMSIPGLVLAETETSGDPPAGPFILRRPGERLEERDE